MVESSPSPQQVRVASIALVSRAARRRREDVSLGIVASLVILVIALTFATRGVRFFIPRSTWLVFFGAVFAQRCFSAWNARCPACMKHIGRLVLSANYCPHCGTQFQSSADDAA